MTVDELQSGFLWLVADFALFGFLDLIFLVLLVLFLLRRAGRGSVHKGEF